RTSTLIGAETCINRYRSAQPMSALGQKQTFAMQNVMSALPPIADMCGAARDVRFVPIATDAPQQLAY
ncbi:MAG: hypothetical protein WCF62_10335, partial [Pseudolabrys sp.]